MRGIFYELITEASVGLVMIDGEDWPISFNTSIYENGKETTHLFHENNNVTLVIKNEEKFFDLLEEYIHLEMMRNRKKPIFYRDKNKNTIKWLMSYLFVNASVEDFLHPEDLLRRNIQFLKDDTFHYLNDGIEIETGPSLKNNHIKIKNEINSTTMETPNRIDLSFVNRVNGRDVSYCLPSIYYGIDDDTCYVYSLLSSKKSTSKRIDKVQEKYEKDINRLLYKLNSGVRNDEMSEYFEYKSGVSSYYPEGNISDVTHSFVLSLSIFVSLLEKNNIRKIKVVPYLPLRYQSRDLAASRVDNDTDKNEYRRRNDVIQENLTNKLIRTFLRVAHHDKELEITSYPYEVDEFLTLAINPGKKEIDNMLLEEANKNIQVRTVTK